MNSWARMGVEGIVQGVRRGGDPTWQAVLLAPCPTLGLASSGWEEAVLTTPGTGALTILSQESSTGDRLPGTKRMLGSAGGSQLDLLF